MLVMSKEIKRDKEDLLMNQISKNHVIKKVSIFVMVFLMITNLFSDENYTRQGIVVADEKLSLVWQDNEAASTTKLTLENAKKYCNNLDFAGASDWRLPNYEELLSIGNYEVYKPTINGTFKHTASGHYWSLMYKSLPTGKNWAKYREEIVKRIYFSDGYSYDNDRTGKAYVRCVRDKIIPNHEI